MALLCLAGDPAGSPARCGVPQSRRGDGDRTTSRRDRDDRRQSRRYVCSDRAVRGDPPTEDDVRNAIERATVSAKRIEIVLSESDRRRGAGPGIDTPLDFGRLRVAAARSSSAWAKRSNPYEQCERRRETVSSKHCATLTAGSTNSWSIPPRPSSCSPSARAKASARSE